MEIEVSQPGGSAPIQILKNGSAVTVAKDTAVPANTIPMPVEIVSAAGQEVSIHIANGDINMQSSHVGANADSMRIGDGTTELAIEAGTGSALVKVTSSALPTGAATAARQDTGNTSLASMDTKLDALASMDLKLADLKTYTDTLEALATSLNGYVDGLETLVAATNTALGTIDGRVDGLEALITSLNGYADGLETLVGATNTALATIDGRVDGLEALITTLNGYVDGLEGLLAKGQANSAGSLSVVLSSDHGPLPASAVPAAVTVKQAAITVGTSAVRCTHDGNAPSSTRRFLSVMPSADTASARFFLGSSSVASSGANRGIEIFPGATFERMDDAGEYYIISDTAAQTVFIVEQE